MNRQQIKDFVRSDKVREIQAASWLFGVDNNQNRADHWDKAKLKILVAFLTPGKTRGVANSYTALDVIIRKASPDVFVDYAYFPHKDDLKVYEKYKLPYWFGNLSHAPVQDYDLLLISTSILVEFLNTFHAYKSCGIPLYHRDRIDNEDVPLILVGGIPVADHDTLGGNSGLVDVVYAGYAEGRLTEIIKGFVVGKESGVNFRKHKRGMIKALVTGYDSIYYPDGYDVNYNEEAGKKHIITSIVPKYDWVPPTVKFHSIHELDKVPGFENKIFNPDNTKASAADFLISQGCSGGGMCSFSVGESERVWVEDGAVMAKEIVGDEKVVSNCVDKIYEKMEVTSGNVVDVKFKSGAEIRVHECHNWLVFDEEMLRLVERRTFDLKVSDVIFRKLGFDLLVEGKDDELMLLTGFIHGDGYVKLDKSLNRDYVAIYTKESEKLINEIADRYLGYCKVREMYKCKNGEWVYAREQYLKKGLVKDFCEKYGWDKRSSEIRVPDLVFKSGKREIISYLKGYFQADGWVTDKGIGVSSISEKMLQDCQQLLWMLGIDSRVLTRNVESKVSHSRYYPDKNYDVKNGFILGIKGNFRDRFLDEIGFFGKMGSRKKLGNGSGDKAELPVGKGFTMWVREKVGGRDNLKESGCEEIHRWKNYVSVELLKKFYKFYRELPGELDLLGSGDFCVDVVKEINDGGKGITYHINTQKTHRFVVSGMLTHNCAEGTNCGGWREISMERAIWSLDETLKNTAANSLSPYSFNLNYYSRFVDLFYEVAKRFAQTSLRNMRIDVIAAAPQYFEAANAFGLATVSMPIEGFGDRIRNKVLNKNVNMDQIKLAFRSAFTSRAMRLKIGMVLTCHETKEDLEDAAREFAAIIKLKEEANVNMAYQCNITLLVHYPHTGVGWLARNSARMSAGQVRGMKDFIGRFRSKIRFKFSSSDFGTAVEQLSLDLGRLGTQVWEKLALQEGQHYYGGWSAKVIPFVRNELAKKGVCLDDFWKARPVDWIFPVEMIPKKKDHYVKMMYNAVGKKQIKYCTKTYANLTPVCYDCGYCTTEEMKDSILKRELGSCKTVADIKTAMYENKPMSSYRVNFQVKKEWALYGKESLAFYIASRIIQQNNLYKKYHSVKNVSNYAMVKANAEDWMWGSFFFDMQMKDFNVDADWDKIIEVVNDKLESGRVISISKVEVSKRIPMHAKVICVAELQGLGLETIRESRQRWKGTIQMAKTGGLGTTYGPVTEEMPFEYPELYATAVEGGSKVAFVIPFNINPHLLMCSLFAKRYWDILAKSMVRVVGYFNTPAGVCKFCGAQKQLSLVTNTEPPACTSCLAKASLKQ